MSEDLDESLRAALRAVDPGEAFTHTVMRRVRDAAPLSAGLRSSPRPIWRWAAGIAAVTLVGAVLLVQQERRQQEGLAARQALMQALRVTAESLELANRAVNERDSGA